MSYKKSVPIKRLKNQFGSGAAGKAAGDAAAKNLFSAISKKAPVDSGKLRRSVDVRPIIRTKNPRLEVTTRDYGLYQDLGTRKGVPRTGFVTDTAKTQRSSFETAGKRAGKRAAKDQRK